MGSAAGLLNVVIAVTHYGEDGRFLPILHKWFRYYHGSKCPFPAVVLTDTETVLSKSFPSLRCDVQPFQHLIRPDHPVDRQGALILAALRILGPCLIVDSDCYFHADPAPLMENLRGMSFAMGDDAGMRRVVCNEQTCDELNAGVLYFGDNRRSMVVAEYEQAYRSMLPANHTLLTQHAWSVAYAKAGSQPLPRELNWSWMWPNNDRAAVVHEHGEIKWNRL